MFTFGGITGVMLAVYPIDWQVHDTYFVVAHFHYVLVAGSVNAIFAALYYWYPKMTGRAMSESLGKLSFWLTFAGFNTTFLVQHSLGLLGMPRRIYRYADLGDWAVLNLISTIGSLILGLGVLVTVYNAVRSLKRGRHVGPDPWKANTLEWFVTSPPPPHNFDVIPRVAGAHVRHPPHDRAGDEPIAERPGVPLSRSDRRPRMAVDGRVLVLAFAVHLVGMLAAAGLFVFILRGQPAQPAGGHPDRGSGDHDVRGRGPDRSGPPLPVPTAGAPPLPDAHGRRPAAARRPADVCAPARDGAAG